jgi:hypothetical protein
MYAPDHSSMQSMRTVCYVMFVMELSSYLKWRKKTTWLSTRMHRCGSSGDYCDNCAAEATSPACTNLQRPPPRIPRPNPRPKYVQSQPKTPIKRSPKPPIKRAPKPPIKRAPKSPIKRTPRPMPKTRQPFKRQLPKTSAKARPSPRRSPIKKRRPSPKRK